MKNIIKQTVWIFIILLPSSLFAWSFADLWRTADQQGAKLLQAGKAEDAASVFKNKDWQAVATYRKGDYSSALKQFNSNKTSDGQYNAGNAAVYLGRYQDAIDFYDKAIALNSNNSDAISNRELAKKLMNENKQPQKNSSENNAKKEMAQNDDQQDAKNNHQEQANQSAQEGRSQKEQAENKKPPSNNQQLNSNQQNEMASASDFSQSQNEDTKQLLRRLEDNPGGLLRHKFMRDYLRRHAVVENKDQGEI